MSSRHLFAAFLALASFALSPVHAQPVAPSSQTAISPGTAGAVAASPVPTGAAAPSKPAGTAIAPQTSSDKLTSPNTAAQKMIETAAQRMNANDVDGALTALNQAINLNPNSTGAYVLRASIYCQRHQWKQAEDDFNAAARLAPKNKILKLQLVELKFMQKQYAAARPGFVEMTKDPDMGDFAQYKVFLCDLYGNQPAVAKKELDVFNDAMGNPSYYFANAAWSLYYKNIDDARSWLVSASRIYPAQKFTMYGQPLRDLGYLPIPEPKSGLDAQ